MNILLYDYSPIRKNRDLCENLQKELDEKNIEIEQLFAGEDNIQGKESLKLFGPFNGDYYTGKYVGVLSYQGYTMQILSRFDRPAEDETDRPPENFFLSYILSKALDIPIQSFPDLKVDSKSGEFWDFLLAKLFMDQLKSACSRGLYRQYRTFQYNDSSPKGVIEIARHIRRNPLQNGKCAYSAREYTLNNPVNHLILMARNCLLRKQGAIAGIVTKELAEHADLRIALQQMEYSMDAFHTPSEQMVLHQTDRPITHTVYREYEPLRKTARLILQRLGLDTFQTGSSRVSGMVFAMDRMWELFLEKAIFSHVERAALSAQYETYILENHYTIRPDLILKHRGQQFVFDAKYKSSWGDLYQGKKNWNAVRNDLYQVISYMHILKSSHGGILFPIKVSEAAAKTYRLLKDEMPDRIHLIPVLIPQSQDSFYSYAQTFDEICRMVSQEIGNMIDLGIV